MIFYGSGGMASPSMQARDVGIQNSLVTISADAPSGTGADPGVYTVNEEVFSWEPEPRPPTPVEDYNWSDNKTKRDYIRLEQKVIAKQATPEEVNRYQRMKQDRNKKIFAERTLRDYEEIRRLGQLSKKLSELERYVRPIKT